MIINESDNNRLSVDKMLEILMKYDVISFDIFDTLILRPFTKPNDLFKIIGMRYGLSNFNSIRTNASKSAREKFSHGEIYIEDIYKEVNIMTNIDIKDGSNYEFEVEKNICYANPYMKEIFDGLVKNNKDIIIVSDMYFSNDKLSKILENCGYKGYKKLYVSCDYKKSKSNFEMFNMLSQIYKDKKVIHIGDNYDSDVLHPQKIGWDSFYYPKTTSFDDKLIKNQLSYNIRSVYNAIVQNHFHNGLEDNNFKNKKYYYGFAVGGILSLGYTKWIHDIAIKEGFQKILFLSRDGDVLKKTYDYLYNDIPSEYLYWSRHAGIKTAIEKDLSYYIFQFINRRKSSTPNITVDELLKDAELDFLIPKLEKLSIKKDTIINDDICNKIIELIKLNIEQVKKISVNYQNAAKLYIEPLINGYSKILIVDIGWKGSSFTSLKYLIEEVWKLPIKVVGTVVGNYAYKKGYDTSMIQCGDIRAYSFSEFMNVDYALLHQKNLEISNSIVETLFTAEHPTFLKYELDKNNGVKLIFSDKIDNNINHVNLIQKGILEFVKEYVSKVSYFPELLNISGRDAYTSIISVIKDSDELEKFLNAFNDYEFVVTVGGLKQKGEIITNTLPEMVNKIKNKNKSNKKLLKRIKKKIKNIIKKHLRR